MPADASRPCARGHRKMQCLPTHLQPPSGGMAADPGGKRIFGGYQWLDRPSGSIWSAFLLASDARILYPVVCLACDRPRHCTHAANLKFLSVSQRETGFFEQIRPEQRKLQRD